MRTKSMILGAALLAAGVASSMAQSNVYSLNVVGYVQLSLTNGLNLVANQLDFDGTGTNNLMTNVLAGIPTGSIVYKFSGGNFVTYLYGRGGWSPNPAGVTLNPGESAFVEVTSPLTITTVGQVLQGTYTNTLSGALTLVSSQFPISGTVDGTISTGAGLGYPVLTGDIVYTWDPVGQQYDTYLHGRGGWSPSDPSIAVGQGFFLDSTATSWVSSFTVQ